MNVSLRTRTNRPPETPRDRLVPDWPEVAAPPAESPTVPPRPERQAAPRKQQLPITLRQAISLAALIVAAAVCGTYAVAKWWELRSEPLRPFDAMKGQWIRASSDMDVYAGLFRRDFRLPGHVRNAWIAVAACDGFEVTVNGRAIGWQHMWRPTRPFQTSLSERGQWVTWPKVALSLNFAREYQWTDHENHMLPVFIDLTPYLRIGDNTVGVEIESRRAPAKVRFDGAITMWSGEVLSLASGTEWRAEVKAPYYQNIDWRSPDHPTLSWQYAVAEDPPSGQLLRAFDPRLYSTEFRGRWIRHPAASAQDSIWFQTEWHLDQVPDEAWLRLATNRNFELFINGRRGFLETPDPRGLEAGEWIYGHNRAEDRLLYPEQMYSEDVGEDFVGHRFIAPRKEPLGVDKHRFKTIVKPPPHLGNEYDRSWALEPQKPLMLRHDRAVGAFTAYNLTGMLRQGSNTIAIRVNRPATSDPANWPGQIAVDGEVSYRDGSRQTLVSSQAWETRLLGVEPDSQSIIHAREEGPALRAGYPLTKLQYRGAPLPLEFLPAWTGAAATTAGGGLAAFAGLLAFTGWRSRRREPDAPRAHATLAAKAIAVLFDALLPFTAVLAAVILLQATFGERSELLWFFRPSLWSWSILAAVALGAIAAGVRILDWTGRSGWRAAAVTTARVVRDLPKTRLWIFLLVWLSLLTFFTRAYRLDFQPMDYDENPSLQALLSVARSGIPTYVPEAVWYTRSPLYHYITGGVVRVFGENLWAARLPSTLFSVATSVLLYFCGSRLLKRPWVGMAAFLLTIIHPQMVMTGHMIRFYQQQQFFALLMAYWFCKGFVTDQSQRYRYLTVAAYLAATLSQEITAVVAVPLGIGYLLFAGRKTIEENIKLVIAVGCSLVIIVVDFAVYETHTLTRLEGFSTVMQADVGPHFWEPYNFLTTFLSYSRIHLILSAMLLLGLPAALWERNRAVLALHLIFFGGIIMLNLTVTQVSARYVYWLFPLLLLLAIDNARAAFAWLDAVVHRRLTRAAARLGAAEDERSSPSLVGQLRPYGRREPDASGLSFAPMACFGVLFAATVISWSPWRLPDTYNTKLLADANGAFQYIRSQLRPGDLVVVTQPHAKGALMEIGQVDYELHIPILYDFVLRENGRLIERGAGAGVLYSVDQVQRLCAEHRRVWFAIDREQKPFRGERVRFDHTGARLELFLRQNTEQMHRTHLWGVFLWDANRGLYRLFRGGGG